MSYENKHIYRDGRITLYTRNGSPTYHARIKVDGVKGYIVKSTKRKTVEEAFGVAEALYDDMRFRVRSGMEIKPYTFGSMWKKWFEANRHTLSDYRKKYFEGTSNRYFLPYFGDSSMEEITDTFVEKYWNWRIDYWGSEAGQEKIKNAQKSRTTKKRPYKQKLGNVAKVPAQKTLQMEQSALRQIFKWAVRNGIIQRVPEIKAPKLSSQNQISRRPSFELAEWQKLYRYLRIWADEGSEIESQNLELDGSKKAATNLHRRVHSLHRWQRQMIRNYILFMGCSGLRPGEARQLRWMDIESFTDKNGIEQTIIHVSPHTKTGQRLCVPLRNTKRVLERIREISHHTEPDDLIFCDQDGKQVLTYGKTFKNILEKIGLLNDKFENKTRTIYSLRHTYATFRLIYGKGTNIENLAQNMGTSPKQIYDHYRHVTIHGIASEMGGDLNKDMSREGLFF